MSELLEALKAAASRCESLVQVVPESAVSVLIAAIRERYCGGSSRAPLWEALQNTRSIHNTDCWRLAGELIAGRPAILFADPSQERCGVAVRSGDDLTCILRESFGFEFYVTNETTDFCIAYNDHGHLIFAGEALKWAFESRLFDDI